MGEYFTTAIVVLCTFIFIMTCFFIIIFKKFICNSTTASPKNNFTSRRLRSRTNYFDTYGRSNHLYSNATVDRIISSNRTNNQHHNTNYEEGLAQTFASANNINGNIVTNNKDHDTSYEDGLANTFTTAISVWGYNVGGDTSTDSPYVSNDYGGCGGDSGGGGDACGGGDGGGGGGGGYD